MRKMLLAGLALAATLTLTACGPHELDANERTTAELGARDFIDRAGGKFLGCSGQDSDVDGYTTCNAVIENQPKDLVCAYQSGSRGCKFK